MLAGCFGRRGRGRTSSKSRAPSAAREADHYPGDMILDSSLIQARLLHSGSVYICNQSRKVASPVGETLWTKPRQPTHGRTSDHTGQPLVMYIRSSGNVDAWSPSSIPSCRFFMLIPCCFLSLPLFFSLMVPLRTTNNWLIGRLRRMVERHFRLSCISVTSVALCSFRQPSLKALYTVF